MALSMVNGLGVVGNNGNHAFLTPAIPPFSSSPIFYIFGENLFVVRSVQMLLAGVSNAMCYLVGRDAGAASRGDLLPQPLDVVFAIVGLLRLFSQGKFDDPADAGVIWWEPRITGN